MKNFLSLQTQNIALIAVFIFTSTGCTSLKEVSSLADVGGEKIVVTTRGGTEYVLEEWTASSTGDILGKGLSCKQYYQKIGEFNIQTAATEFPFEVTIPADSIVSVKHKAFNLVSTYVLANLIIVLAAATYSSYH